MPVPTASNYPAGFDGDTTLFRSHDRRSFTLASGISDAATVMIVTEDCSGLTGYFFLAFSTGELVYVTSVTTATKTMAIVRGVGGSPAIHNTGEVAKLTMSANILEQLKRSIVAIESALGLSPQGAFAGVGTRIATAEGRFATHNHTGGAEGPVLNAGTVDGIHASASPVANALLALDANGLLPTGITGNAATVTGLIAGAYQTIGTVTARTGTGILISGGVAALYIASYYYSFTIDTEGYAASDALATITGGAAGDLIFVRAANSARAITMVSGGNIALEVNASLSWANYTALWFDGSNWHAIGYVAPKVPDLQFCTAYRSTDVTGTYTQIPFNVENDPHGWHATNSAKIIVPEAGMYIASAYLKAQSAGSYYPYNVKISKNDTSLVASHIGGNDQDVPLEITVAGPPFTMAANDYVTLGYTGVPVSGNRTYYIGTRLSLVRIG